MSTIDPSLPVEGTPTTQSVRDNFQAAADDIDALDLAKAPVLALMNNTAFARTPSEFAGTMFVPQTPLGTSTSTNSFTSNTIRLIPFAMPRDATLQDIKFNVTIGAAGNCRIGLYDTADETNSNPGALLYDSGNISIAATGIKTGQPMLDFSQGKILFAALFADIAATWTSFPAANCIAFWPPTTPNFTVGRNLATVAQTYGALPPDLSAASVTYSTTAAPMLGIAL